MASQPSIIINNTVHDRRHTRERRSSVSHHLRDPVSSTERSILSSNLSFSRRRGLRPSPQITQLDPPPPPRTRRTGPSTTDTFIPTTAVAATTAAMCKLYKYQEVDPASGTVYKRPTRTELCSRSRHGQPCSATQEFRRPIGDDQFPPTPPLSHSSRSSRSPSTSDSERHARKRSDTYYVKDGVKIAISRKSSSSPTRRRRGSSVSISISPRRDSNNTDARREKSGHVTINDSRRQKSEHVSYASTSAAAAQRSNTGRRLEVPPAGRRPPSPAESDPDRSRSRSRSYHEVFDEREDDREYKRELNLDRERDQDRERERKRAPERERSVSPISASSMASTTTAKTTRPPVKQVIIAEDPKHKHHRSSSKSSSRSSVSGDDDRVRYYTTQGESLQSQIASQNQEIANRPIRERERKQERDRERERDQKREAREARESREPREIVRHPRPSRNEVVPLAPASTNSSTGSKYRRPTVHVPKVDMSPLTTQYNSMAL